MSHSTRSSIYLNLLDRREDIFVVEDFATVTSAMKIKCYPGGGCANSICQEGGRALQTTCITHQSTHKHV